MKLSNKLCELISSMNKNEKGFFVKFAQSQREKSNYLDLFHALCDPNIETTETLEEKYPNAGFLKNINFYQNYLYEVILKSLRFYFEDQHIDIQLYALLSEINVLEAKGLKKQSAMLLKKAKKKALAHHQYPILIEILKKQATQLVATSQKNLMEETSAIYAEIFDTLKIIEEEFTYRKLSHFMLLCYRQGAWSATQRYPDLLKSISDDPAMNEGVEPRSFFAKYLKYNIRSIEAQIYGDSQVAHTNYLKILSIWEAHPALIKSNPNFFKINISNFLSNAILINQVDEFEKYIKILEGLETRNEKEKIESFQNVVLFRILFFLNQNRLKEGEIYIKSVEKKLETWTDKLNPARAVAIYYNILMLYFLIEEFGEAQKWANLILNKQNKDIRVDAGFFARIMKLIIHYELNDDLILDSLHISLKRQLAGKKQKDNYEKTILLHFKHLMNNLSGNKKTQAFVRFKNDIAAFKDLIPQPISINELLIWLDARIEKKSLQEMYTIWLSGGKSGM